MIEIEISDAMKKQAAAAAGYYVRRRVTERNKFYFKTSDGGSDGQVVVGEDAAWELAWKDLCRRRVVWLHKKGGIYAEIGEGRLCDRGDGRLPEVMVYEHLAPHDRGIWVRDLAEFDEPGRFVRIVP